MNKWVIICLTLSYSFLFILVDSATQKFRIGLIADLDTASKEPRTGKWRSYLKEGDLYLEQDKFDPSNRISISIEWDESANYVIKSGLSYFNRGMELSTLNVFSGRLLSCDDKTGVLYELVRGGGNGSVKITPTPWAILANGHYNGNGFECQWATIKYGDLLIGGDGRTRVSRNGRKHIKTQKFIKRITPRGEVSHWNWEENYDKMAKALGVQFPGYVTHEAGGWSDHLGKWLFMPRYVSNKTYDSVTAQRAGSNLVLKATENFDSIQVMQVGEKVATHGFTDFKWIPNTNDQLIVAIRSSEVNETLQSFILAFDIEGKVLLPEMKIDDRKYEGIEFI